MMYFHKYMYIYIYVYIYLVFQRNSCLFFQFPILTLSHFLFPCFYQLFNSFSKPGQYLENLDKLHRPSNGCSEVPLVLVCMDFGYFATISCFRRRRQYALVGNWQKTCRKQIIKRKVMLYAKSWFRQAVRRGKLVESLSFLSSCFSVSELEMYSKTRIRETGKAQSSVSGKLNIYIYIQRERDT